LLQLLVFLVQETILSLLPRAWVFPAQWQDRVTILLQVIKVWVAQVNRAPDLVDLVQQVLVARVVQADLLVQQVLVAQVVQVDLLHVQVGHPVVPLVAHREELQVLVLQVVAQVLVAVVAAAAQRVLSVRVDLVTLQRLESLRESNAKSSNSVQLLA
jgi:hypothetical protein